MRKWRGCRGGDTKWAKAGLDICKRGWGRRAALVEGARWTSGELEEFEEKDKVLVGVGSLEKASTQQEGQLQECDLPRALNLERSEQLI